jgi:hypothetical protein
MLLEELEHGLIDGAVDVEELLSVLIVVQRVGRLEEEGDGEAEGSRQEGGSGEARGRLVMPSHESSKCKRRFRV